MAKNPALAPRATTSPQPPAQPPAATTGTQPTAAQQTANLDDELETADEKPRLRGFIVKRQGRGETPSYLALSGGTVGWTWEISRATVFPKKSMAEPLIAEKVRNKDGSTTPAGVAASESAQVVKFDESADDNDDSDAEA